MIENAVVIDNDLNPLYWHLPAGRTSASIPDSRKLWDVLWSNRDNVWGVAHSHPGGGRPWYSGTDVTTFAACESGLGKRFIWPIITENSLALFAWLGPDKHDYGEVYIDHEFNWVEKLRRESYE